jgi:hypothetical protein
MNDAIALETIRSGNGKILPIVEYYATTGNIENILSNLEDNEARTGILYILSELPKLSEPCLKAVKALDDGKLSDQDRHFIRNIL